MFWLSIIGVFGLALQAPNRHWQTFWFISGICEVKKKHTNKQNPNPLWNPDPAVIILGLNFSTSFPAISCLIQQLRFRSSVAVAGQKWLRVWVCTLLDLPLLWLLGLAGRTDAFFPLCLALPIGTLGGTSLVAEAPHEWREWLQSQVEASLCFRHCPVIRPCLREHALPRLLIHGFSWIILF